MKPSIAVSGESLAQTADALYWDSGLFWDSGLYWDTGFTAVGGPSIAVLYPNKPTINVLSAKPSIAVT